MQARVHAVLWAVAVALAAPAVRAYPPQINYMLNCMGCHEPDGAGEPGRVPSFRSTLARFAGMADGRRYIVQVPGSAQSRLSDAELAAVLNWMIVNLSDVPPARLQPFTPEEVGSYRRTPLIEVRAMRERLLRELH